jgi:uncharacterized protein (TIGR03437 family)
MRIGLFVLIAGVLAAPGGQAATIRSAVFSLTAPPGNSGCAAPMPSDYFESTDSTMTLWFDMANMNAGDTVVVKWTTTAGKLDASSNYQPLSASGGHCFWLTQPLSGNSPGSVAGIWTYSVLVNNTAQFSRQVQVVGPNDTSINRGGVVNTASGVSRTGMIAAGSLVSIYGHNLAPFADQAGSSPLPTNMDGVTVTFNGIPVGIEAIAPGEIDVQAPWGIPSDTVFVQVNNNGALTNTERVRVASADPGVFFDPTTNNQALVYRFGADGSDGGWVGPGNPLLRGDTAVFLATGLGAVADPPANFNSGNSDSAAALPVTVFFDGAQASNVYAGLADDSNPLDVGVTWIYATVPNEVPNGSAVPVTLQVAAAAANAVTVPVAGVAPPVTAPVLLSIGGYPAVNASGGYNPASAISIAASGVYANAKTYAKFADSTGYSVTIPALAVYSDRVISMVPPYLDQKLHQTNAGTVQCSIVQLVQGQLLTSNAQTMQIAALHAAPGATGHLTAEYLATLAQDARTVNGGYTYKQEISNGTKFMAVSANQFSNAMTTGLQPLVGGAEEMAGGNASSISLGSYSLDSNSVALMDALIAAVLRENAKAYQAPPVVTGQIAGSLQPQLAGGAKPDSSILGSLASYFGKVAQCNMPWNQISDEVNGTTSNCPTFGQALNTVAGAAADSLREAVDSTLEDAKRFAKGPGLLIGVLAGGEAIAVASELVTTAAELQAATHIMLSTMESGQDATADQKAALKTITDEVAKQLAKDATAAVGEVVGSIDEQIGQEWEQAEKDPIGKVAEQYLENLKEAPTTLEGPRDETNPDGTNSLDTSADNAPAMDITGKVTNGSGTGLQNVGVGLTDGNGDHTPVAVGVTNTDGTFDLTIPVGAAVPSSALFQVTALDETGDIATFDGATVNLAKGPQSIGTSSISYDNDNDGDDDSDGSEAIGAPIMGQAAHRPVASRPVPVTRGAVPARFAAAVTAKPGRLRGRVHLAPRKAVAGRPLW